MDPPPRRVSEVEKRLILLALASPPPTLPTDCPDLTPLLDLVEPPTNGEQGTAA
jgi:hypothetical protein